MQRRDFLKISAIGAAGAMIPASVAKAAGKNSASSYKKPNDGKIRLGFIGLGQQAMYLLSGFMSMPDVKVMAGCDVYDIKRDRFYSRVYDYYTKEKGEKKVKVDVYEDYQDILNRPDIDAVVIAVPDHQHAVIAIAACKAGKDVYLEKPLTLTIYEGQQLCKAVRKYNRILQVGSQQRSSEEFQHAVNLVREGRLGKVQRVNVYVGRNVDPNSGCPAPNPLPEMPIPAGLNWDKWLGPLPTSVKYHSDLDPYIGEETGWYETLWGAWRWYQGTGGGLMTDWGAHMFDIAQWAVGKDYSGPVKVIPAGYSFYKNLTYIYDNGIVMTEEDFDHGTQGVKVYGEKGWIQVSRGNFKCSSPEFEMKAMADDGVPYETKVGHHRAFIESIKSRIDPNVPVEIGHSSCTVCNLGNIATKLGRPVVWNPIVQKFMDDPEATAEMHYQYRPGYSIDV